MVASIVLVLLCVSIIAKKQMALIDGRLAFRLQDDMMISMRYVQNLACGFGLIWNLGGVRIEGYSNLIRVLMMALVHLL